MAIKFGRIYVELSNNCNFNCPFCPNSLLPSRLMSLSDATRVLIEASQLTNEVCLHVMGEPLMYPYLAEVLEICKQHQLKINLVTNGFFLTNKLPLITEYLTSFSKICVSLHGYAYREDNIKDTLDNIFRTCVAIADMGVAVEIRNLKEPLSQHFCQALTLSLLSVTNTVLKDVFVNQKIKERCFYVVKKKFVWPEESKGALTPSKHANNRQCLGGKAHIAILANLKVVPCCLDSRGDIVLGDLSASTLTEILNSSSYTDFRKKVISGKPPHKLCSTCEYHKIR